MLLTKTRYRSWADVAADFPDYVADVGPWSEAVLIDFFEGDLGKDESSWPFSRREIREFYGSEAMILEGRQS